MAEMRLRLSQWISIYDITVRLVSTSMWLSFNPVLWCISERILGLNGHTEGCYCNDGMKPADTV